MPEKNEITDRLVFLRLKHFGKRGKRAFARALGIPLSTYSSYESGRVPPVHILVKISEITGCNLNWLLTGQLEQGAELESDSEVADILARLEGVIKTQPKAKEAIIALLDLLAVGQQDRGGRLGKLQATQEGHQADDGQSDSAMRRHKAKSFDFSGEDAAYKISGSGDLESGEIRRRGELLSGDERSVAAGQVSGGDKANRSLSDGDEFGAAEVEAKVSGQISGSGQAGGGIVGGVDGSNIEKDVMDSSVEKIADGISESKAVRGREGVSYDKGRCAAAGQVSGGESEKSEHKEQRVIPIVGQAAASLPAFWLEDDAPIITLSEMVENIAVDELDEGICSEVMYSPATQDVIGQVQVILLTEPMEHYGLLIDGVIVMHGQRALGRLFAVRISGDSMEPLISEGDIVIGDTGIEPKDGDLVLAELNERIGAVCKFYFRTGDKIRLSSANRKYSPIETVSDGLRWIYKVVGKVCKQS